MSGLFRNLAVESILLVNYLLKKIDIVMLKRTIGIAVASMTMMAVYAQKNIPLVYGEENTGKNFKAPAMPGYNDLRECRTLTNPFEWSNGKGKVKKFKQWERRRNEIAAEIQHYGIGVKPTVDRSQVKAWMNGDTVFVDVTVNGETLHLSSTIRYPKGGQAPYPLMIGTSNISLPRQMFDSRNIATMTFHEKQVNDYGQFGRHHERGEHNFDRLYPNLSENGAYSEWAWGLSRLLDGLEILGEAKTKIDMKHIGVTGCSYAGKMALMCGAFDERVALTIAQEPGGGGAAAWRVSKTLGEVESLERTDYLPLVQGEHAYDLLRRQSVPYALRPS